jgi:hypothetical protein
MLGQALAHALDALGQQFALRLVDHAHQLVAEQHLHRLHHRQVLPLQLRRRSGRAARPRWQPRLLLSGTRALIAGAAPADKADRAGEDQE